MPPRAARPSSSPVPTLPAAILLALVVVAVRFIALQELGIFLCVAAVVGLGVYAATTAELGGLSPTTNGTGARRAAARPAAAAAAAAAPPPARAPDASDRATAAAADDAISADGDASDDADSSATLADVGRDTAAPAREIELQPLAPRPPLPRAEAAVADFLRRRGGRPAGPA